MLAIGIRYLCGWAMAASDGKERARAEWPPHPDRVFMALAAAHFETGADPQEREALEWIESLPDPGLAVEQQWSQRTAVTAFVPVNDSEVPRASKSKAPSADVIASGVAVLPEGRSRQPKRFPVAVPSQSENGQAFWNGDDPIAFLVWPEAHASPLIRSALERLTAKVIRVGHPASLVQAWIGDQAPEATLTPQARPGGIRLRTVGAGRLLDLQARFPRRPTPRRWTQYGPTAKPVARDLDNTVFDPSLLVFRRISGRRLGLGSTLLVTSALRGLLMKLAPQPASEWLSGHGSDGSPTPNGHVAFLSLGNVGHDYADGNLLGVGVAFPMGLDPQSVSGLIDALMQAQHDAYNRHEEGLSLYDGAFLDWRIETDLREARPLSLQPRSWTGPAEQGATTWATVTPLVLDRFPKKDGDVEGAIELACQRIGLPRPIECRALHVSMFRGVPVAAEFPAVPFKVGPPRRYHTHAWMRFDRPVVGPVLLGAGRFKGYGLCRPFARPE